METAILLFQCADQSGIIAAIAGFIFGRSENIITMDQYSTDPENGHFFVRSEFSFDSERDDIESIKKDFALVASKFDASWHMYLKSKPMRMGILVSKPDHCLIELLYRWQSGDLPIEIPMIISNHEVHQKIADQYGIPYYYLPVTKTNKREDEILDLVKDTTDFLVLARYMQIISADFLTKYKKDIINIHHSFLPSFAGANPYKQAYERGVKIIGATAHYVTKNLDEGPIIEQMVAHVSHKDDVNSLKRKGKHLEKLAVSQAIHDHVEHKIIRYGNKTIVFR